MKTLLLCLLLLASSVSAQTSLPELERVLLPIAVENAPGAYGSRWTSEADVFVAVPMAYVLPLFIRGCVPPCNDPIGPTSGTVIPLGFMPPTSTSLSGYWLYVQKSDLDRVFLSLRLKNVANTSDTGVELPVVRAPEFRSDTFSLVGVSVPTAARRLTVRIYSSDPSASGTVRVSVFGARNAQLLRDDVYPLDVVQQYYTTPGYSLALRPPMVEIRYPELSTDGDQLRIDITPLTAGLRAWAFASITDNATQKVSIYRPQ